MIIKLLRFIIKTIIGDVPDEHKQAVRDASKLLITELAKAGVKGAVEALKEE